MIARAPGLVLVVVLVATAVVASGAVLTEQDDDGLESFVDADSPTGRALAELGRSFPEVGRAVSIQLVARGDVMSADAVNAVVVATDQVLAMAEVASTLDPNRPVVTYASLVTELAGVAPGAVADADVERVIAMPSGENTRRQSLDELLVVGPDGELVAGLGIITQQRGLATSEQLLDAGRSIEATYAGAGADGQITVSTVSNAQFEAALQDGLADTQLLFPLALLAVAVLLAVFYRTVADTLITLAGVLLAVLWFVGAQGLLGPRGLGIVGPAGVIGAVIPVMMIGLSVDYALQFIGRRREHVGGAPADATEEAVRFTGAAIALGACTTAIAFSTNTLGPLPPIRDFGLLAAVGIVAAMIVMLTFVPAARTLLDRRRSRRNVLLRQPPIRNGLPFATTALRRVAGASAQRASAVLVVATAAATGALVFGLGVSTDFANSDFLPDGHPTKANLVLLTDQLGGTPSTATILVTGDLSTDAALDNLARLDRFLTSDPAPRGVASQPAYNEQLDLPVTALAASGGDDVAVINVDVRIDTQDTANALIDQIESIWTAPGSEITVVGDDLLTTIISNEITSSQRVATLITIATALVLLVGYFGISHRRPGIGVAAVAPILAVLAFVLAFMRATGTVYNPLTALLTSLTIGLGVDYTIHFTHRYLDEADTAGDPHAAIANTAESTGASLVASSLTTVAGFTVLALAPVSVISDLGLLTAATIAGSILVTATILPALLV
ncbi:MAG: MMPL family transporter, partial [Actinomycetota bacterium]